MTDWQQGDAAGFNFVAHHGPYKPEQTSAPYEEGWAHGVAQGQLARSRRDASRTYDREFEK